MHKIYRDLTHLSLLTASTHFFLTQRENLKRTTFGGLFRSTGVLARPATYTPAEHGLRGRSVFAHWDGLN